MFDSSSRTSYVVCSHFFYIFTSVYPPSVRGASLQSAAAGTRVNELLVSITFHACLTQYCFNVVTGAGTGIGKPLVEQTLERRLVQRSPLALPYWWLIRLQSAGSELLQNDFVHSGYAARSVDILDTH